MNFLLQKKKRKSAIKTLGSANGKKRETTIIRYYGTYWCICEVNQFHNACLFFPQKSAGNKLVDGSSQNIAQIFHLKVAMKIIIPDLCWIS